MSTSSLYEGIVRHRRTEPAREFRHPVVLAYIDLEELPKLLGGRLVAPGPGVVRFRRSDYLGDPAVPLQQAVRDAVAEQMDGRPPAGPIRMLTQLRTLGHCFNPVSFYYCFDQRGERLEAVVAEVTNTPWGERHAYVVPEGAGCFQKALHVSPFMDMDHIYQCRAGVPGRALSVHIENRRDGARVFDATLALRRRQLTRGALRRATLRYPLGTMRVLGLIYVHALGLRLAGATVYAHPRPGPKETDRPAHRDDPTWEPLMNEPAARLLAPGRALRRDPRGQSVGAAPVARRA